MRKIGVAAGRDRAHARHDRNAGRAAVAAHRAVPGVPLPNHFLAREPWLQLARIGSKSKGIMHNFIASPPDFRFRSRRETHL